MRLLRSLLAALALLTSPLSLPAADAPSSIVVERVLAAESPSGGFPTGPNATAVTLPDRWSESRPGYSGSVWYRAGFRIDSSPPQDDLVAVYIEQACSNLQLRLNGFLIFSGGRMVEPVSRNCGRPQLVALPTALLRPGENTLDLHLRGFATEEVSAMQRAAALSRLEIGTQSALFREHRARWFWNVTWNDVASLALLGIGCVLLAVGWLNRREVYFTYLGLLCLAWVVISLALSARDLPWANGRVELLLAAFWPVLLALAAQFFLSFAGLRSRTIELVVALQWLLVPLTLLLAGPERLFVVARAWYVLLSIELLIAIGIYLAVSRRQRPGDFAMIAGLSILGIPILVHELGVQWLLLEPLPFAPAGVFVPIAFATVGASLFLMFARAVKDIEADRNRVAGELRRLAETMDMRVEQMTAQRIGEFGEQERKRIASDLHDDLGAKLLMIIHTTDPHRLAELSREALDEMRLSVRGLAGKAVRLDDAIADWRAETVARLGQAGIEPRWDVAALDDSPVVSARTFMQLSRIVREAINNVIKHSGARSCRIRCSAADGVLNLQIKDDGRGISEELTRGQGVVGMKKRAKRLSGQCLIESAPDRGVVISCTVPL